MARLIMHRTVTVARYFRFALGLLALGGALLGLGFAQAVGFLKLVGFVLLTAGTLFIAARLFRLYRVIRGTTMASQDPTTGLCDLILEQAVAMGAGELHLTDGELRAYHRGTWKVMFSVPMLVHTQLVNRLKVMASLDMSTDRQQGTAGVKVGGRDMFITITVERTPDGREEGRVRFA